MRLTRAAEGLVCFDVARCDERLVERALASYCQEETVVAEFLRRMERDLLPSR